MRKLGGVWIAALAIGSQAKVLRHDNEVTVRRRRVYGSFLISPSCPPYLNKRRFGLTYIDFKPQKRTPKLSAEWSHEAAFCNGVV